MSCQHHDQISVITATIYSYEPIASQLLPLILLGEET